MKKTISLILVLTLILALCAGCSSGKKSDEPVSYVILDEVLGTEQYAIGFRKDDEDLCAMVNSALAALVKDGTYKSLGEKYPEISDFLCLDPDTIADVEVSDEAKAAYGEGYTFTHGFDLDYPPYSHLAEDGSISGFDVELCQAVCDYLGWNYESLPFNWDAKDGELNSGACDCIWSGFTLNGREDDYCWSVAYSDNTQVILTASNSDIKSLADLAGKKVGVQTATSAYDMLNDEEGQAELADSFGDLLVYETYTVAFNDLKAGAIDAIAIDKPVAQFLIAD